MLFTRKKATSGKDEFHDLNDKGIMTADKVAQFIIEITRWTSTEADILALALVGSMRAMPPRKPLDVDLF